MSKITVSVSKNVESPAAIVYNILANYNHHRNILPPNAFAGLDIEAGGIGDGTQLLAHFNVMGIEQQRRQDHREPGEPDRPPSEVSHVCIERLSTRHGQEDGAEDEKGTHPMI